jgi:ankyrin repeat protein
LCQKTAELVAAAKAGDMAKVKELVGAPGVDINGPDEETKTALWWAAREGKFDVVKYLVGQGADVNQARADGVTPLSIAVAMGHLGLVKYLAGASWGAKGTKRNAKPVAAELLFEAPADKPVAAKPVAVKAAAAAEGPPTVRERDLNMHVPGCARSAAVRCGGLVACPCFSPPLFDGAVVFGVSCLSRRSHRGWSTQR